MSVCVLSMERARGREGIVSGLGVLRGWVVELEDRDLKLVSGGDEEECC